jgi:hypothetical protein
VGGGHDVEGELALEFRDGLFLRPRPEMKAYSAGRSKARFVATAAYS